MPALLPVSLLSQTGSSCRGSFGHGPRHHNHFHVLVPCSHRSFGSHSSIGFDKWVVSQATIGFVWEGYQWTYIWVAECTVQSLRDYCAVPECQAVPKYWAVPEYWDDPEHCAILRYYVVFKHCSSRPRRRCIRSQAKSVVFSGSEALVESIAHQGHRDLAYC